MARFFMPCLRWAVTFSACAYPLMLVLLVWFIRSYDGTVWLAAVALYAPRFLLLLPLPVLVIALLVVRQKRLLWTQAVALLLILFPVMGFTLPHLISPVASGQRVRILSFNVNLARAGPERIADYIRSVDADLVFLQEIPRWNRTLRDLLAEQYHYVEQRPYSLVGSRYPIVETTEHEKLPMGERQRSGRFQRHEVQAPFGRVAIYNIHPISPRGALNIRRFRDALHVLRKGRAVNSKALDELRYNVELRRRQIKTVAREAHAEKDPVILAGDFNLPDLSGVFQDNMGSFEDSFRVAGAGFGYTFPSDFPWMRLDRILSTYDFRAVDFEIGCDGLSDHRCVVATLAVRQ